MKNYKQILEAINKGIQLALDDFDDNELIGQQTQTIKDHHITKDYLKLTSLAVDMGLPSGTWWFKYNLGVNPDEPLFKYNIKESWYGDYYAWGELVPKLYEQLYSWENYKFAKGNEKSLTKYCSLKLYGYDTEPKTNSLTSKCYSDNLTELLPEDDIATQTYGKGYHIPTKEQWDELIENTELYVDDDYQGIYDNRAFILVSKLNGNKIYIPAAGYQNWHGTNSNNGIGVCLWSSTLYNKLPNQAWRYSFRGIGIGKAIGNISWNERCNGYVIRPVYNN